MSPTNRENGADRVSATAALIVARTRIHRGRRGTDHARHVRRPASRRHGPASRSRASSPRSRGRCPSSSPAASSPRRSAKRSAARRRSASTSRPASKRRASQGERPRKDALKVALFAKRARAARARPAEPPEPTDAGRPVAARGGRPRPLGRRSRVRRPVRPRDADGRAPSARGRLRRAPPRPALLGGAARAPGDLRRPPDAPLPRGPPRGAGPGAGTRGDHRRRHAREPPPVPQARGRRPHRRPQDQQRARPGAAHAPARQDPGHRRDGRRAARRRDRDGVRAARAALRRVHGRRGHRAPAAERAPDARARRRGAARSRPARATLKDAINEAMRDWVTNVETTHYVLGSAMGPHPYPTIVRDLQRRIGDEAAVQLEAAEGRLPDLALACVGGGSNAIGLLSRFIGEPSVRLAVAEAAGDGIATGRHAAALAGGSPGILHGARSMMLQDRDGQVVEAVSASAGLDYPGVGPQLSALHAAGRIELAAVDRRRCVRGDGPHGRDRGHPARARDGPRDRGAAPPPRRHGGEWRAVPDGRARAARLLRPGRQGPRVVRALAGTHRPTAAEPPAHDRDGTVRDRIQAAFEAAQSRGPGRARARTSSPAIRTSRRATRPRSRASTPARTCSRSGCRTPIRSPTARRSSEPPSAALKAGATFDGSIELVRRIAESRPRVPLVPMCYANQVIGGGDGREAATRASPTPARRGSSSPTSRPTRARPSRRSPPRRASPSSISSRRRRPPDRRRAIAERSGGFLYCVSLVGVTGARTSLPAHVARLVRDVKAVSPVPVAVGFGVSRPAHVRALAKAGADGVIVASALVDALGEDGRDVAALAALVRSLREAGAAEAPRLPSPREPEARSASRSSSKPATRRSFASALDWPGWSRSGKTDEAAIEALLAYAPRYAPVAKLAGLELSRAVRCRRRRAHRRAAPAPTSASRAGSTRPTHDRLEAPRPTRLAAIVEAAWTTFDRVAAGAPAELRKGPRGGGRDRDKMVGHVVEADWYYAREIGLKVQAAGARTDRAAVEAMRDRGPRRAPPTLGRPAARGSQVDRRATPRAASPGTPSTTPGRCRTARSRSDGASTGPRRGDRDAQDDRDRIRSARPRRDHGPLRGRRRDSTAALGQRAMAAPGSSGETPSARRSDPRFSGIRGRPIRAG